jgi:hypothetical protein
MQTNLANLFTDLRMPTREELTRANELNSRLRTIAVAAEKTIPDSPARERMIESLLETRDRALVAIMAGEALGAGAAGSAPQGIIHGRWPGTWCSPAPQHYAASLLGG